MRRRAPTGPPAPERLARFVPSEWPGGVEQAFGAWREARLSWHREHIGYGNVGPLGDAIDIIREHRAIRHQIYTEQP